MIKLSPSFRQNSTITSQRLHQLHVTEIELHLTMPELFLTSSWDGRLRIWDIRQLDKSLAEQKFSNPLNSISLSADGRRLVCNDTHSRIHVLNSLDLNQSGRTWHHPHVQQQRAALLRARLHPTCSRMAVIARQPSVQNTGTVIDLIDLTSGQSKHQWQLGTSQFCSATEFNCTSEMLASTTHNRLSVWMPDKKELTSLIWRI